MATPQKPILENIYLETFFFFTPWRQVWPNFIKMMGEQEAPGDSIDYTVPKLQGSNEVPELSLLDYFGLPLGAIPTGLNISALPFRCYNKIFNFWFRDENLVEPLVEHTADTNDIASDYIIASRRKRRDYITSGLPFPRRNNWRRQFSRRLGKRYGNLNQ